MAGVKISKLKNYEEVFHDENFDDRVNDMIIPVSLGKRTISVKIQELVRYMNIIDEQQNTRLDEQAELIMQNKDLINQQTGNLLEQLQTFKTENASEHREIRNKAQSDKNELIERINSIDSGSDTNYQELVELIGSNKDEIEQLIDSNKDELEQLISGLDAENQSQHTDMQNTINENEQVTALGLIDLQQITQKIKMQLHDLREEAESVHEQIKNDQKEIDDAQNEKIDDIIESVTLWEIYDD